MSDYDFSKSVFSGGVEKILLAKLRNSMFIIEGSQNRIGSTSRSSLKEVKLNGKVSQVKDFGSKVIDLDIDSNQEIVRVLLFMGRSNCELDWSCILKWQNQLFQLQENPQGNFQH